MKVILLFVLILLTAAHSLPLNEFLNGHKISLVAETIEECVDETKKEKFKQIGFNSMLFETSVVTDSNNISQFLLNKSQFLHQVESPPPDFL